MFIAVYSSIFFSIWGVGVSQGLNVDLFQVPVFYLFKKTATAPCCRPPTGRQAVAAALTDAQMRLIQSLGDYGAARGRLGASPLACRGTTMDRAARQAGCGRGGGGVRQP